MSSYARKELSADEPSFSKPVKVVEIKVKCFQITSM